MSSIFYFFRLDKQRENSTCNFQFRGNSCYRFAMEERLVEELKSPSPSPSQSSKTSGLQKETITSKAIASEILKLEDSDYEIQDIKQALKRRHEDIDRQQRICDYLLKSFKTKSKEYAKVQKVGSRLIIARYVVKKNNSRPNCCF